MESTHTHGFELKKLLPLAKPNYYVVKSHYGRGGQIAACGPNVARHSAFSGPQKCSGKSSNLKVPATSHSKY